MKNTKSSLNTIWGFAIFVCILASVFSVIFGLVAGGEKKEKTKKDEAPAQTEEPASNEDGDDNSNIQITFGTDE